MTDNVPANPVQAGRLLVACFETPGFGGASTSTYALYRRLLSSGVDACLINLIPRSRVLYFESVFGNKLGNPDDLPGVRNSIVSDLWARDRNVELELTLLEINPRAMLAVGYIAARILGGVAPDVPLVFYTAGCRQATTYVSVGSASDAMALSRTLDSRASLLLTERREREAVDMADLVLTHSDQVQRQMAYFYPSLTEKLHRKVIWSAEWIVDTARHLQHFRRAFGEREIDLLLVASDWERPEKALSLVKEIVRELRGLRIHIVGRLPSALPGVNSEDFVATSDRLYTLFGNAKTVACPSILDAAPGILYEASIMGCNIVTSKNVGNWRICNPELLCESQRAKEYGARIRESLRKPYSDNIDHFLSSGSYAELLDILDLYLVNDDGTCSRDLVKHGCGNTLQDPESRVREYVEDNHWERVSLSGASSSSDVSAVLLTIGEESTDDSLARLGEQSLPLREVIVVRGVSPFHRAFNLGAHKVRTPWFAQVDADMLLDPGAIERLRAAVSPNSGIVVGKLRDAMIGQTVGLKLFRTECFVHAQFPNSISPDTDFVDLLEGSGWVPTYLNDAETSTLGDHAPDYSPSYVFRKYELEGRRYRYRRRPSGLRWMFERLENSNHEYALLAQVGLCNGLFLREGTDLLELSPANFQSEEFERAFRFCQSLAAWQPSVPVPDLTQLDSETTALYFGRVRRLGCVYWRSENARDFRLVMGSLRAGKGGGDLIAKIAVCHGLLRPQMSETDVDKDGRLLDALLWELPTRKPMSGRLRLSYAVKKIPGLDYLRFRGGVLANGRLGFRVRSAVHNLVSHYTKLTRWPIPLPPAPRAATDGRVNAERIETAYLVWRFPVLFQSFIQREIRGLQKAGVPVRIFTMDIQRAQDDQLYPGSVRIEHAKLQRGAAARALLYFGLRRPLRLANLLLCIMTRRYHARKRLRGDIQMFFEALQFSYIVVHTPIAHVHAPWADKEAFMLLIVNRLTGIPYSVQGRAYELHRRDAVFALREKFENARFAITNSDYNKRLLAEKTKLPEQHFIRIYNGVFPNELKPRAPHAVASATVRILSVGRLIPKKGFHHLLDASALLRDRGVDFKLDILGAVHPQHRNYWLELRLLRNRQGLVPYVDFPGRSGFTEVCRAYERADFFVLPCVIDQQGDHDIIPNAVLEAMAMQLPVIASRVGAIPEMIKDEVSGFLVHPGDAAELADVMHRMVLDVELRRRMGRAGRERILERFDGNKNYSQYADLFRQSIEQQRRTRTHTELNNSNSL